MPLSIESSASAGARSRPPICAIDLSTLARWLGPSTGMLRVEHELAQHALSLPERVTPVVFDEAARLFRPLSRDWARLVLDWSGHLYEDPVLQTGTRTGWRRLVPSRHPLLIALEVRRLRTGSPTLARACDATQRLILALKPAPFRLDDPEGRRIHQVPYPLAVEAPLTPRPGDRLLLAASDWYRKDPAVLHDFATRFGVHLSAICYDILPITHPALFPMADVERFTRHWDHIFSAAQTIIVNSQHVRGEVEAYAARRGFVPRDIEVVPLGASTAVPPAGQAHPLRAGLESGRFALFVSTIEPRKNHALLLRVWRRLLDQGVPQRLGFKLVFAGRRGWAVDEVLRQLDSPALFDDTVIHVERASDPELWALYDGAAFCLYPSHREGFGLPVVEAYARGKPVLVSSGGSLPEAAGGYAPLIGPDDDQGWEDAIRRWMEVPAEAAAAAERIRRDRPFLTWPEVAGRMFEAAGFTRDGRACMSRDPSGLRGASVGRGRVE